MDSNLIAIYALIQSNQYIKHHFTFNFRDAELIAELRFGDHFFIYYSKNSSNYLLFHYSRDYFSKEGDKNNFSCHKLFSEVLEEINCSLTDNYVNQFNVHTKKWHSSLPPWLNLFQYYVNEAFKEDFLIEMLKADENIELYSKEEIAHIMEMKLNLQLK
jgi:hypothetical protein